MVDFVTSPVDLGVGWAVGSRIALVFIVVVHLVADCSKEMVVHNYLVEPPWIPGLHPRIQHPEPCIDVAFSKPFGKLLPFSQRR